MNVQGTRVAYPNNIPGGDPEETDYSGSNWKCKQASLLSHTLFLVSLVSYPEVVSSYVGDQDKGR